MTDNAAFNDLLDGFESAASAEDVWDLLFAYVTELGVDGLGYHHIAAPGAHDFDKRIFISRGFDPADVAAFKQRRAISNIPLENRTLQLVRPIFWHKAKAELGFTDADWQDVKDFYCKVHNNGFAIPVHGSHSRSGCVVLRLNCPKRRLSKAEIRQFEWAAQYAHKTYCRLIVDKNRRRTTLTRREQEILTWVARGKSNSVIADIIGISQHTVNGYLRHIYLKTGTSDRTTASLRGIGEALIDY